MEITMAKMGRSMKKREITISAPYQGLAEAAGAPAWAGVSTIFTGWSGRTFGRPSTITRSPASMPESTTQRPPTISGAATWRTRAKPSLSTT
ncbi:hypothetical protein D3C78_1581200 [compost metagenome]